MGRVRLHVNVDHVATLRNARGSRYPDPVHAAALLEAAGADGITVHLREDRRHIRDRDVEVLRRTCGTLLNLEMAGTEEMVGVATRVGPDMVTLVPEKREERTTEGGLDVVGQQALIADVVARLQSAGVVTSLFIDPEQAQIEASAKVGAAQVELHTGDYALASAGSIEGELTRLARAAQAAATAGLALAAGHGLTARNVRALVARLPGLCELNIGHALVSDAVFMGLDEAYRRYRRAIDEGSAELRTGGGA